MMLSSPFSPPTSYAPLAASAAAQQLRSPVSYCRVSTGPLGAFAHMCCCRCICLHARMPASSRRLCPPPCPSTFSALLFLLQGSAWLRAWLVYIFPSASPPCSILGLWYGGPSVPSVFVLPLPCLSLSSPLGRRRAGTHWLAPRPRRTRWCAHRVQAQQLLQ